MFVNDPGVYYRFLFCGECKSIRYHSIKRLEIRKIGTEWWVRVRVQCFGVAPLILYHRRRLETDCLCLSERWMPASQWNVLCLKDSFAA